MDQETYKRWWALHVRVALGESLQPEDQAFYETGQRELDEQDDLGGAAAAVQQTRNSLPALEAEIARLRAYNEKLNAEIAALEAALDKKSRQLLGVQEIRHPDCPGVSVSARPTPAGDVPARFGPPGRHRSCPANELGP